LIAGAFRLLDVSVYLVLFPGVYWEIHSSEFQLKSGWTSVQIMMIKAILFRGKKNYFLRSWGSAKMLILFVQGAPLRQDQEEARRCRV
jgi:hypothetical protein